MGRMWFIRHGLTPFNKIQYKLEATNMFTPECYLRFDEAYCDQLLAPEGVAQALSARKKLEDLDIDTVIVSPLRRALNTCKVLFRNHYKSPKIIVHPIIHEQLACLYDTSLYEGEPYYEFKDFDWSFVPSDGKHITSHIIKNSYSEQLNGLDYSQSRNKIREILRKITPEPFESYKEAYERAQKAMEVCREIGKGKNLAVVGHREFFTFMLSPAPGILGRSLKNCEIYEL